MSQLSQQPQPAPITPEMDLGIVGELLHELGLPVFVATTVESLLVLAVVLSIFYIVSRAVLLPIAGWALARRGVDTHSKRLLLRLVKGVLIFFAVNIALVVAGYSVIFGPSAIWLSTALAFGFVFRRRLVSLLLRGLEYSEPHR